MTRFVVDASAVLHLASTGVEVPGAHKLLADQLGWASTYNAEYVELQADAFVTLDAEWGDAARGTGVRPPRGA